MSRRVQTGLALVALAAAVWLVFGPVVGHQYAGYDEREQLLENPAVRDLSLEGLARIARRPTPTGSYYPVRTLSLAVGYALWGTRPAGHHAMNVVLHMANVWLLFALALRLLRGRGDPPVGAVVAAALGAGLFALHPVVVEPVAWVGAREELLLVLCLLGAVHLRLLAYDRRETARRGVLALHAASIASGAAAALASAVGAVGPVLLLAADTGCRYTPSLWRRVRTVLPLAAVAAAVVVAKVARQAPVEAGSPLDFTWAERAALVPSIFARNLATLAWPARLTLICPFRVPADPLGPWVVGGVIAAALVAAGLAWAIARGRGVVAFGAIWFVAALAPSSQLLAHHLPRADRLLYLPLAGLAIVAAALVGRVRGRRARAAVWALAGAVLVAAGVRAAAQVPVWATSLSLFQHAVAMNPQSDAAHNNLGAALDDAGRHHEAARHYEKAVRLAPGNAEGLTNLALARVRQGRRAEAISLLRRALEAKPDDADNHYNLGVLLAREGEHAAAADHYARAAALDPGRTEAWYALGNALARQGRLAKAVAPYERAIALKPAHRRARYNLGAVLARLGRTDEAAAELAEAARLADAAGDEALLPMIRAEQAALPEAAP